jgi:hypothetical protein
MSDKPTVEVPLPIRLCGVAAVLPGGTPLNDHLKELLMKWSKEVEILIAENVELKAKLETAQAQER